MQPEQQPSTQWQFDAEGQQAPATTPTAQASDVSWSASEFIAYHKSVGWYLLVLMIVILLAAAAYGLTKDKISSGSIVIIGIMFVVFASRKPRVLTYQVNESGIRIGEKALAFSTLRSFAVIDEGNFRSIMLLPMKRFMPPISMYFEPQDEDKIANALGNYLPKEDRKQDTIDRFMHKIHF